MSSNGKAAVVPARELIEFDVRPLIAAGEQPFRPIMQAVEALTPGAVLRIVSPFNPKPLHGVLEGMGFARSVRELGDGDWESDYWRPETREPVVLDVRGLAPPEPLERTLAALAELPDGDSLLQVNDRVPAFLLPLLDDRGYTYRIGEDERGTLTTIWREPAA